MKLNNIEVSEKYLLSELAEWEGKTSSLAYKIAERYGMVNKDNPESTYVKVENVRKVLSTLKKKLLDTGLPVNIEAMFPPFEGEKQVFNSANMTSDGINTFEWVTFDDKTKGYNPSAPSYTLVNKLSNDLLPIVYLVIGDLHEPYSHIDYLNHCLAVLAKWTKLANVQFGEGKYKIKIVFIGDEVDNHALSYHESNPNLSSAGDELTEAKANLSHWYKALTGYEVFVIEGNHSLAKRKAFTAGIPSEWIKEVGDVLGVPKWNFCVSIKDSQYKIHFHHGTKVSAGTGINFKAVDEQMSQVCGHHHTKCQIEMVNQSLFTMFVGCGINFESRAFDYARGGKSKPILSCAVIFDGQPILEPMKLV